MAAWQQNLLFLKTSLYGDLVTSQKTHTTLNGVHMPNHHLAQSSVHSLNYDQGLSARGNILYEHTVTQLEKKTPRAIGYGSSSIPSIFPKSFISCQEVPVFMTFANI